MPQFGKVLLGELADRYPERYRPYDLIEQLHPPDPCPLCGAADCNEKGEHDMAKKPAQNKALTLAPDATEVELLEAPVPDGFVRLTEDRYAEKDVPGSTEKTTILVGRAGQIIRDPDAPQDEGIS